jgi:choice-of-anchor B domain-containing protein
MRKPDKPMTRLKTTANFSIWTSIFLLSTLIKIDSNAQDYLNVSLYAQFDRGEERYSGSWVYSNFSGEEYALLGAKTGTAIYQIMPGGQLEEVAFIPGPITNWREITVVQNHAYVVTDVSGFDHGMQVIRLNQLPFQAPLVTTYDETFTMGHIIQKDISNEDPYVYVCGTTATEGVHIMDVSIPETPIEVGLYDPGYYIHDCHVNGDRMFGSAFYEGTIDIVDISDKTSPTLITRIDIPDGFVHSSSLTTDGNFLFVAPEKDELPARIFDITNPFDPVEVAKYTANPLSLVHNPYILGDFAFLSHNTEGLRVVDMSDPTTPVEVGYYDTWAGGSGGFHGLWSACPYLPSGKIVGGNREDGLYVWEFNQTKAGRLYGTVLDSISNLPISNAEITLLENDHRVYSSALGEFRTGAVPGNYVLLISAEGYLDKTIEVSFYEESEEDVVVKMVGEITEVNSTFLNQNISVYPNPFSEELVVENGSDAKVEILVVNDILGKEKARFFLKEGVNEFDTKSWADGVYFINILNTKGAVLEVRKLIKG